MHVESLFDDRPCYDHRNYKLRNLRLAAWNFPSATDLQLHGVRFQISSSAEIRTLSKVSVHAPINNSAFDSKQAASGRAFLSAAIVSNSLDVVTFPDYVRTKRIKHFATSTPIHYSVPIVKSGLPRFRYSGSSTIVSSRLVLSRRCIQAPPNTIRLDSRSKSEKPCQSRSSDLCKANGCLCNEQRAKRVLERCTLPREQKYKSKRMYTDQISHV